MPISRDVRALLTSNANLPPDDDNSLVTALAEAWLAKKLEDQGEHVRSSDAPFYASDGAGCARRASYDYLSRTLPDAPEPSDPPTIVDEWRFNLGNLVHDELQAAAPTLGFENEYRAVLSGADGTDLVSTRGDMVKVDDGVLVEIKSATGFKYKKAATTFSGPPEGPMYAHVVQLALTRRAMQDEGIEIKRGVIVWAALEVVAPHMVDVTNNEIGRFLAQWTFEADELDDLADEILAHLAKIKDALEAGVMPPAVIKDPEVPAQAQVVNPNTGRWEVTSKDGNVLGSGSTWMCRYCRWQTRCISEMGDDLRGE